MTDAEIDKLSTPAERAACKRYKALQAQCRETDSMGETELLIWQEAVGILVARNKRLGLIP